MEGNISRRSFFAQLRKRGFSKANMQLTRVALTYIRESDQLSVTVPKGHSNTFHILGGNGSVPTGFFVRSNRDPQPFGHHVSIEWCPLTTCLEVLDGKVIVGSDQLDRTGCVRLSDIEPCSWEAEKAWHRRADM